MDKTLYISDLDGTLLTSDGKLSEYTASVLQKFKQNGGLFSAATARTWESILHNKFLDPVLPLAVPVVLMNGALVYDTQAQRYVKRETIPPGTVHEMLALAKAHGQTGFLYHQKDDVMRIYVEQTADHPPFMQHYYQYRKAIYRDRFIATDNLPAEDIVYFTMQDEYDKLTALYAALQTLPGIGCILYIDHYFEGCWFLECFSRFASKNTAVRFLRETCGFDKIVGFGDNLNDLPLFEACDEGYAVANAREELKAAATGIIGANTEDGVARFLEGLLC